MKFINSTVALFIAIVAMIGVGANAQEILPETAPTVVKDTVKKFSRQKIDGIIATVGDYIILDSDIDMAYIEMAAGGASSHVAKC